ncbi:DUF4129 domain-containing protein [Piscinibacter sp. HJYY11]|uniref:DUF4129 domain-containing protein n=1 Tax=Piscinibacter sp. HJYY11 TaxID=2801333 RepID=UPI00191E53DD|nr:DUF4129 domain-containing protein [Piscinibacter sp. HJYY11]MBL0729330.1 DUF4129 domain-containing protein [Piscinibacter sp. HJYY11]
MRSEAIAAVLLSAALLAGPAHAADAASAPTREQVRREVAELQQDPSLSGKRLQKTLRFKDRNTADKKKETPKDDSAWAWLRNFSRWLTEAGRVAVWVVGLVMVALLLVGLRHWIRVRAGAVKGTAAGALPSHVRDLDIRPESLPDRIGEAAAALWQKGEHRAALSLLYRGALSRLVHQHQVPIRAASTEGECLALAARRLAPERSAYFGRLVQAWQVAVYGARLPENDTVVSLCRDFDLHLRSSGAGA